jgi:hypothetical protein
MLRVKEVTLCDYYMNEDTKYCSARYADMKWDCPNMKLSQQLYALKSSWGISHIRGEIKNTAFA